MKGLFLFILAIFLSISSYAQTYHGTKAADGKANSIRAVKRGRVSRYVPTEGDGTGNKLYIKGRKSRRVRNVYDKFITSRQRFNQRKYNLKTAEGKTIRPNFKK